MRQWLNTKEKCILRDLIKIELKSLDKDEYGKYKYFLSTSKFEGNPKTILEAINNKCIVFATDISNHSEIISNGFNGYLYSDLNDLVEKFNNVKNKQNLQNNISINCEASLANNQIDKVIEKMYQDYELLISFKYRAKT